MNAVRWRSASHSTIVVNSSCAVIRTGDARVGVIRPPREPCACKLVMAYGAHRPLARWTYPYPPFVKDGSWPARADGLPVDDGSSATDIGHPRCHRHV